MKTVIFLLTLFLVSSPSLSAEVKPQVGQTLLDHRGGEWQGEYPGIGSDRWIRILRDLGSEWDSYVVELSNGRKIQVRRWLIEEQLNTGILTTYDPVRMRIATIKSKGWPEHIQEAVLQRKIILGMTKQQVELSWGKPERINRSVGTWGVNEQWVYEGQRYIYFQNGKLTSWQDSK